MFFLLALNLASAVFSDNIEVYFGNGCFFHQQHVMVLDFEKKYLNRTGSSITSVSAYGGGEKSAELCYHNPTNTFDYGKLGHAEVVSLAIPTTALQAASTVYFNAFTELTPGVWTRHDFADMGGEYRAIIGVPGGIAGPLSKYIQAANRAAHNLTLLPGHNITTKTDPDTMFNNTVYIMDSLLFPATQAELCLQFHDDALAYSPPYSADYRNLTQGLVDSGRLRNSTCPPNYIC